MKALLSILIILLLFLQYKLWLEDGSIGTLVGRKRQLAGQLQTNKLAKQQNQRLQARIRALKTDAATLEEEARVELNMIKRGEAFYQIIEVAHDKGDER